MNPDGWIAAQSFKRGNPVPDERILANIRVNQARALPWLPAVKQHDDIMLFAAGGPSLALYLDEIRRRVAEPNIHLWTSAGTHDYLIKNGIVPRGFFQLDPKPSVARYLQKPHPDVLYVVSTGCDPAIFDALKGHRVLLAHCPTGAGEETVCEGDHVRINGGSSTPLRCVTLAFVLGFQTMEFYGLDACVQEGRDYAYDKSAGTGKVTVETPDGRKFLTTKVLMEQAEDFRRVLEEFGEHMSFVVHGDGLISHLGSLGYDPLDQSMGPFFGKD
jgi:hypothetical protein